MTTLEDLYSGNINPCELEHLTKRDDYNIAMSRAGNAREELEKTFNDVQKRLFEKYIKEWDIMSLIVEEEIFKEGFSLAMRIKEEVADMKELDMHKDFESLPPMLTVAEVAEVLRVSLNQMYYLIDKNKSIPIFHLGRKILVPRDELKDWIKRNSCRE